jgi:hypothetical protein
MVLFSVQLIVGSDNTYDYYGESDLETTEDLLSVNNSEVFVSYIYFLIVGCTNRGNVLIICVLLL